MGLMLQRYPGTNAALCPLQQQGGGWSPACVQQQQSCFVPPLQHAASKAFEIAGTVVLMISPLPSNPPCWGVTTQ